MPIQPTYKTGTITVTSGSATVTGTGTAWTLALVNGGSLSFKGFSIPIAAVASDTSLTLDYPAPAGMAGTGAYSIYLGRADAASAIVANRQLADLVDLLRNKVSAFGGTLLDDADASTALSTLGVSAFAKTLLDDADAGTARGTLGSFGAIRIKTFSASGTYTPDPKLLFSIIEVQGGGGAGGSQTAGNAAYLQGGGGGSGGSYSRAIRTKAQIGASQAVTVGAGGIAGGAAAGATSVGTLATAPGGVAGAANGIAAAAGALGTGDMTLQGMPGNSGPYGSNQDLGNSGVGGSSFFGSGGNPAFALGSSSTVGNPGIKGGGGSGAITNGASPARVGGTGGSGYVVITEFCSE